MDHREMAETYWRTYLPSRYASIPPGQREEFFRDLSSQVREQVASAVNAARPEAGLPADATYLEMRAAHQQVRDSAREIALADLVFLPPEPGTEDLRQVGFVPLGWDDASELTR